MNRSFMVVVLVLTLLASGCKKESSNPTTPAGTLPTSGLVAYYPFNGGANDASGNGGNGTVTYAAFTTDRFGKANSAYSFDGVQASISTPTMYFAHRNQVSVSLWAKIPPQSLHYFIMCSDFGIFSRDSTAGMAISLPSTNSASGPITPNTWTHIVGTYDSLSIRVYIGGVLRDSVSWPGTLAPLDRNLVFGQFGTAYWQGSLDDIRIYNRPLTPAEVLELYHEGGWN
jgi:hypothetical protein